MIGRIAGGNLEAGPAGKDRVLLGPAAAQHQVLHAVDVEELGRVDVSVEDDDVQVLGVRRQHVWGFWDSGMAPMPERQKAGAWKETKT